MAISLNSTLTLTPIFSHSPTPKLNHHKSKFISCRATTGTGTTTSSTATAANASDFYKILCLKPQESDIEEIKKAYRIMALKYHPDVCNNNNQNSNSNNSISKEESTRKFLQVHAAYKTLSDPVLREEYDKGLLMNIGFGCKSFRGSSMADFDVKKGWRDQLDELKRKSAHRTAENGSSWASRMRSQNSNN